MQITESSNLDARLDDVGILRIVFTDVFSTKADVQSNLTALSQYTKGKAYPTLIDFSKINGTTLENEQLVETFMLSGPFFVTAFLTGTAVTDGMEKFLTRISGLKETIKLFNDESEADAWLAKIFDTNFNVEQYASRNSVSVLESADTKTAKIFLGSDGIIRIISLSALHTEEYAKENIAAVNQIAKEQKFPLLIDHSKIQEMTPESRKYYETEESIKSVSVMAILLGSGIASMTANFLINIAGQSSTPRRLFNDENKAILWLKDQNDKLTGIQLYAMKNNVSIVKIYETDSAIIFLGDDGIVRILATVDTHTEEAAKEVAAYINLISKDKRVPVLIDSSKLKEMTPESRTFYESEEVAKSICAIAIIIKSGLPRIMVNILMDLVQRPGPPKKLFNDEEKAVLWLMKNKSDCSDALVPDTSKMSVLVFEPVQQLQKPVIYTLIKNGIKCLCLQEKKEIIGKLKSKKFTMLICSYSPDTREIIEIIQSIKKDPDLAFVQIVLWSTPAPKKFFEDMIVLGIKGIIMKPFVQEVFEKKILSFLYRDRFNPDRRQVIRVEPGVEDRALASIRTANTHKTIVGKITSLSMNGMVIELMGNFTDEDIKENDDIINNNIKITINEFDVSANGIVLKRTLNIAVIRFTDMQEYNQNMLSSYIYKRLN